VIIDSEGYILTNDHVVRGADSVTVTLPDGREFPGEIRGTDYRSDLAIVKINAKNLPVAELGDSDRIQSGQWVVAIGNPFGWAVGGSEPTVTVGVVSALHRSLRVGRSDRDYSDLIQTDAAINPGNSGGPLVDLDGRVIGINVAIFSTTGGYQGIGFAIPINTARAILADLIEGKKVLYGWLGVNIQDVTPELSEVFHLPSPEGVIVARVLPNSPAEKGGLKDGDVIVRYEGEPVKNVRELLKKVARTRVGQKVTLRVIREGKERNVTVEVGERPAELEAWGQRMEGTWRGLEVRRLTKELAERYGHPTSEGVIVSHVEPGSPADRAGLRVGDLLLEINRLPIASVQDFLQATAQVKGPALVKTTRGYFVVKAE
jgi:serine protease Do